MVRDPVHTARGQTMNDILRVYILQIQEIKEVDQLLYVIVNIHQLLEEGIETVDKGI